jgi:hypothetical protein
VIVPDSSLFDLRTNFFFYVKSANKDLAGKDRYISHNRRLTYVKDEFLVQLTVYFYCRKSEWTYWRLSAELFLS